MKSSRTEPRDCLIAVVNNNHDLRHFLDECWYRIPARSIGRSLGADILSQIKTLALYQSAAVTNGLPGAIEVWGSIASIEQRQRREILPDQPDHPAANQQYWVMRVHRVERLAQPLFNTQSRRLTFLRTTTERLLSARMFSEVITGSEAEEELWNELRGFNAERRLFMRVGETVTELDFAIFHGDRSLGILCRDESDYVVASEVPASQAWRVLRFAPADLDQEFARCIEEIKTAVHEMQSSSQG